MVGITSTSHYRWVRNDEDYAQAVEECRVRVLDELESTLYELGINGNVVALNSVLNARGKERGYGNPSHIIKEVHTKKKLPVSNSVKKAK